MQHDPDEAHQRDDGLGGPLRFQLVGAVLQGAGRDGDAHPGPRGAHVGGVVAAAHGRGEARAVDAALCMQEHRHGDDHRRHDSPEDPPPREVDGEPRRDRRSEQGRKDPGRRHVGEQPWADGLGVDPPGDDVEHDDEQAAAQAGEGAAGEEDAEAGGCAAHGRAAGEECLAGDGADHRAGPVGPHAGEHDAEELGGEHHREGEAVGAHRVEVAGDRGHGRGDRHRLERDDRDEGQDGEGDLEVGAARAALRPGQRSPRAPGSP